jgi:hypothetical protein
VPPLIRYIILNFANGFSVGALAALSLELLSADATAVEPLVLWLKVFALGAPFGIGALATALVVDADG